MSNAFANKQIPTETIELQQWGPAVFLRGPCRDVISGTSWKLQSVSQWREELVVGVRWPPAWELVYWNNEQLWNIPQPVRTSAEDTVRIRYQKTASEDWEHFMYAVVTVIFTVCRPVRLLYT
jgi:hypothetical protein